MIIDVIKSGKHSSFKMSQSAWQLFWDRDFIPYKIGYIVKGYEIKEDGDISSGWFELYYNERLTLRQAWHK